MFHASRETLEHSHSEIPRRLEDVGDRNIQCKPFVEAVNVVAWADRRGGSRNRYPSALRVRRESYPAKIPAAPRAGRSHRQGASRSHGYFVTPDGSASMRQAPSMHPLLEPQREPRIETSGNDLRIAARGVVPTVKIGGFMLPVRQDLRIHAHNRRRNREFSNIKALS